MSLYSDMSAALSILTEIKTLVNESGDDKLKTNTNNDLQLLISVFQNPIIKTIASVQDSVSELSCQLQEHPSLLPVDFDISPVTGQLVLSLPSESTLYNSVPEDLDQRVPKLSNSSSTESSSPTSKEGKSRIKDISTTLPPITTPSYAVEFQKAVDEASRGRKIHNVQLYKPGGSSLGFSVVGLRSEEKGELGIFVQEIQQNGIAARSVIATLSNYTLYHKRMHLGRHKRVYKLAILVYEPRVLFSHDVKYGGPVFKIKRLAG